MMPTSCRLWTSISSIVILASVCTVLGVKKDQLLRREAANFDAESTSEPIPAKRHQAKRALTRKLLGVDSDGAITNQPSSPRGLHSPKNSRNLHAGVVELEVDPAGGVELVQPEFTDDAVLLEEEPDIEGDERVEQEAWSRLESLMTTHPPEKFIVDKQTAATVPLSPGASADGKFIVETGGKVQSPQPALTEQPALEEQLVAPVAAQPPVTPPPAAAAAAPATAAPVQAAPATAPPVATAATLPPAAAAAAAAAPAGAAPAAIAPPAVSPPSGYAPAAGTPPSAYVPAGGAPPPGYVPIGYEPAGAKAEEGSSSTLAIVACYILGVILLVIMLAVGGLWWKNYKKDPLLRLGRQTASASFAEGEGSGGGSTPAGLGGRARAATDPFVGTGKRGGLSKNRSYRARRDVPKPRFEMPDPSDQDVSSDPKKGRENELDKARDAARRGSPPPARARMTSPPPSGAKSASDDDSQKEAPDRGRAAVAKTAMKKRFKSPPPAGTPPVSPRARFETAPAKFAFSSLEASMMLAADTDDVVNGSDDSPLDEPERTVSSHAIQVTAPGGRRAQLLAAGDGSEDDNVEI